MMVALRAEFLQPLCRIISIDSQAWVSVDYSSAYQGRPPYLYHLNI